MKRKLLAIFAHPDDESFGPGGTTARYARLGVEIHLLCASRGEEGQWHEEHRVKNVDSKIEHIREKELMEAAKVLGITKVEFLGIRDGSICNANYHALADKIGVKLKSFEPHVVITDERLGISGHLDHIGLSMITTYAYKKSTLKGKLYYYCITKELAKREQDYFVYFPEGYDQNDITTTIDVSSVWDEKIEAMKKHQSQIKDVQRIIKRLKEFPKEEYFMVSPISPIQATGKETDLFSGIF